MIPRFCRAVWGEFFILEFVGLFFPGLQAPPKNSRPKFAPKLVGIPLQFHFLEPKIESRRFSACGGGGDRKMIRSSPNLLRTFVLCFQLTNRPRPFSLPNPYASPQEEFTSLLSVEQARQKCTIILLRMAKLQIWRDCFTYKGVPH